MKYEIVRDGRKLRSTINKKFIKEAKYEKYPFIDCKFEIFINGFKYKNNKYIIKYIDGNFYPLVFLEIDNKQTKDK